MTFLCAGNHSQKVCTSHLNVVWQIALDRQGILCVFTPCINMCFFLIWIIYLGTDRIVKQGVNGAWVFGLIFVYLLSDPILPDLNVLLILYCNSIRENVTKAWNIWTDSSFILVHLSFYLSFSIFSFFNRSWSVLCTEYKLFFTTLQS